MMSEIETALRNRAHPKTSALQLIKNALHGLNLDRNDVKDLPDGATVSYNISTIRNAACALLRAKEELENDNA
jgi:hypothetical protein